MCLYITNAQKAAGMNLPIRFESRPAVDECPGGSEARPVWKKRAVKMVEKNIVGEVVKRESKMEKAKETKRRDHRGSLARQVVPEWKVKEDGKVELNPMLLIPCLLELGKLSCFPVRETTPQPPCVLSIIPAWIAEPHINESARYIACSFSLVGPPMTSGL